MMAGDCPERPTAHFPRTRDDAPAALADRNRAQAASHATRSARAAGFARAVRDGDEAAVEEAILRLSRTHRALAPLGFAIGGVVMLFNGLKLLFSNWRLTVVQILPAMWIWLAMFDLKAHALHGKSVRIVHGPVTALVVLIVAAITAASFFLNAVFAFAIVQPARPKVRPAFTEARSHLAVILAWGGAVGLMLGLSTTVVARQGAPWFGISLSLVIGIMTVCYVAVPARLIGVKQAASRRDKLAASAVGGAIGAVVCTPPYLLARAGILLLGSPGLVVPGIVLLTAGATLQAGATGAVKSVKMSAKLISPSHSAAGAPAAEMEAPVVSSAVGRQERSRRTPDGGE